MFRIEFADKNLAQLEVDPRFTGGYSQPLVRAFRKVMQVIRAAHDERDLYAMKSLRFEKLEGNRSSQRSLRLNDQWRLIIEISGEAPAKTLLIVSIEDYH
jgi:toxin HigB-1